MLSLLFRVIHVQSVEIRAFIELNEHNEPCSKWQASYKLAQSRHKLVQALCVHQKIGDWFNGHWRDSHVLGGLLLSPFGYTWTNKQRLEITDAIAVSNRVYPIKKVCKVCFAFLRFDCLYPFLRFDCLYPGAKCYSDNKTYLHFANFVWDGDPVVSLNRLTGEYHVLSYGNWELIP